MQLRVGQVGADQGGVAEVGAAQIRPLQIGADQAGMAQIGAAEVGVAQIHAAEIGPLTAGLGTDATRGAAGALTAHGKGDEGGGEGEATGADQTKMGGFHNKNHGITIPA